MDKQENIMVGKLVRNGKEVFYVNIAPVGQVLLKEFASYEDAERYVTLNNII